MKNQVCMEIDSNSFETEFSIVTGAALTLPALAGRAFRLEQLASDKADELVKFFANLASNKKSVMHGTLCIGYATTVLLVMTFMTKGSRLAC